MGLFDNILEKLGLKKTAEAAKPATPGSPRVTGSQSYYTPSAASTAAASAAPKPVAVVDVVGKLEGMAKKYPMKLNWKESIVDLLVLLDLPHKGEDLKELAVELKCPDNIINDSFKRNMWLHKAVLKAIADNGGNIPKNLLD
jgi:hypothetical protein